MPIQNVSSVAAKYGLEDRSKQAHMLVQTVFLDMEIVKATPVLAFKG